MLVAMAILLTVAGIVMSGMTQMMFVQGSVANRSEMHSSVRNVTELIEQEIGQAGRISLPNMVTHSTAPTTPAQVTLQTAIVSPTGCTTNCAPGTKTVTLSSVAGMFTNIQLTFVDAGANQETVQATAIDYSSKQITAYFSNPHAVGQPILVDGGFATGIVPADIDTVTAQGISVPGYPNGSGSTGYILKLYGDVNNDGNMVYIEYNCSPGTTTAPGTLSRSVTTLPTDGSIPAKAASAVLLDNVLKSTDAAGTELPCFTYQEKYVSPNAYVLNVAVTLTVQTPLPDPKTHIYQQETKALLNVAPRNVFDTWQLASANVPARVQPIPPSVGGTGGLITQP